MQNKEFSRLLAARQDEFAAVIVRQQFHLQADICPPLGELSQSKSVRDVKYHLAYLGEAVSTESPGLFFDYIAWVKVLFKGLGFPETVLPTTLECIYSQLSTLLGAAATLILDTYVKSALENVGQLPSSPPLFINPNLPMGGLAKEYVQALLGNQRRLANDLILGAIEKGTAVKDIYLHVFQPSQREIGRLWQTNQISVAQEHYCTAVTQMIMSQLYAHIFGSNRIGRQLLATSVGGELHEIGIRMVADFFEMEGWDTYYLGANTPLESILRTIEDQLPDVLGISATITYHLPRVAAIINQVRTQFGESAPKILVGGYPFLVDTELWKSVGADGFGRDAQEAVTVTAELIKKSL